MMCWLDGARVTASQRHGEKCSARRHVEEEEVEERETKGESERRAAAS